MPLKKDVATAPYDFADYIGTASDARTTLVTAFEDGDPAAISRAIDAVARSKGMSALAAETGLTRDGLYKAFAPNGNPGFRTIVKVLGALGYKLKPVAQRNIIKRPVEATTPARAIRGIGLAVGHRATARVAMAKAAKAAPKASASKTAAKKATAVVREYGPRTEPPAPRKAGPKKEVASRA